MKKVILILVLLAIAAGVYLKFVQPSSPGFEPEEGYALLYDGKTLDGWRVIGGDATFEADGESIRGSHGPGANTFLRSEKTYADFNLRLQMRWDEPGNSGVLFRAKQRESDGRAYGYQYELDHSERSWSGGIYDEARRGWLGDLQDNAEAREAIKHDDWNEVEIEAVGASLKTWINGVPAASIVDVFDAQGFIALQVHAGDVGTMRWRRIRIKELDPRGVPGEPLSADSWQLDGVESLEVSQGAISGTLIAEQGWLSQRRRFTDASIGFSLPACDKPTVIRMRYEAGEASSGESFVEASIYADRAEARLVTAQGVTEMAEVPLQASPRHRFTGVAVGDAATLSIGEVDVLRVSGVGLSDRGELQVSPANCTGQFELADFAWTSLREKREENAFYKSLDTAPAPVLSPEEALEAFRIAPGFEIELVAAEPLVEDPVAMAWDEYGRLYVVEMRGYMPDAYGTGSEDPVGQVVRLEDIDGDGVMDTSEVFLDKLVNPRAVAVTNEGVLVGEPPQLWLCELPTADALCSNKRSVGGYAHGEDAVNVEHMENRLLPGLDNWLYNAKSARRLRLLDGKLQQEQGPFRGQWGISKDDYGRLYYNHNSTWLQMDFFQGDDIALAGVEAYPKGLGENLTEISTVYSVRVNPGVNRAYLKDTLRSDGRLDKATGVSGLAIYRGDQFTPQYRGQAFVPESAGNVVAQFTLVDEEAGVSAQQQLYEDQQWGQRDFLGSTDERFRPVDAANGPDGALYIIDMYRGIIQDDHFLTEELREQIFQRGLDKPIGKGRIWRVRHSEGHQQRGLNQLGNASLEELLAALSHANGWVRDTAQRLLLERSGEGTRALQQLALAEDTLAALHALWVLHARGELSDALLVQVLALDDSQRQIQALRAGVGILDSEQLLATAGNLQHSTELVKVQYAFALGAQAQDAAVRQLIGKLLSENVDSVYIRQAVVRAVNTRELAFLEELVAANWLTEPSDGASEALRALGASAYRSIRPDMSSSDAPDPALLELLALTESRRGDDSWQQIALLSGFQSLSLSTGFVPASLEAAPPIFADSTVSEKDPLWDARLASRASFTWPGDELALGIKPLSPEQIALMEGGKAFYPACANCHGPSGAGITGLAPALAGVSWVTGPPEWLGRIILQGINGPIEVNGEQWQGMMPPHGHMTELDDETLAGLMTFLRRSWGNKADPVSVEQAAEIRSSSADRTQPWTVAEIEQVPFDRGFGRYVGKYTVSFITMTIEERPEGLYMSVPMYGEGLLESVSDTTFKGENSGKSMTIEFELDGDGPAPGFTLYSEGQKIPLKRK